MNSFPAALSPEPGPLLWITNPAVTDTEFRIPVNFEVTRLNSLEESLTVSHERGTSLVFPWIVIDIAESAPDPLKLLQLATLRGSPTLTIVLHFMNETLGSQGFSAFKKRLPYLIQLAENQGFIITHHEVNDNVIVFKLHRQVIPYWQLSAAQLDDLGPCLELFTKVFDSQISPDLWRWKYGNGRGKQILAWQDKRLVAHYGSISRKTLFMGQETRSVQISDVMVDPSERGIMTRKGPFQRVASAYQEAYLGYCDKHPFGYGFPNKRHMILGNKLGLYAEVDRVIELSWAPAPLQHETEYCIEPIVEVTDEVKTYVSSLWQQMQTDLSEAILVIRDTEYLQYRYFDNPQHQYQMMLVRLAKDENILGLVILRIDGHECRLMDMVCGLRNINHLVTCSRHLAHHWNLTKLFGWITSSKLDAFTPSLPMTTSTDIYIPGNIHVQKIPIDRLRNRWWLMMGDTDFL